MDLSGTSTALSRFPLVPRKRPLAKPLEARVARLVGLAENAHRDRDAHTASIVFNGAALVASDCADAELARVWCRRHAALYLNHAPLDSHTARYALEPVVNLARLHVRVGNGAVAHRILTDLYHVITSNTPAVIDGLEITHDHIPTHSGQLQSWLRDVMLADGTRALTLAGHWDAALAHVRRHTAISATLHEGRQVAAVALTLNGDAAAASALLRDTTIEQPWQQVVRDLLQTWHASITGTESPAGADDLLRRIGEVPLEPGYPAFRTRLGLAAIDLTTEAPPSVSAWMGGLIAEILHEQDANAAHDLLRHPHIEVKEPDFLQRLVEASGLGLGHLPRPARDSLAAGLDLAEAAINEHLTAR